MNTVARTRSDGFTFYMDRTEVTVKAYRECVDAGICTPPAVGEREPDEERRKREDERGVSHVCPKELMTWYEPAHDDYPINCVTFSQAWRYCQYRHGRLPTGYEWEFVARGTSKDSTRRFPWGDTPPSCRVAVMANRKGLGCGTGGPMPVGSKPKGASPGGALDMVGNVTEIILTNERPSRGFVDDADFTADGGSYANGADSSIFEPLGGGQAGPTSPTVGFRCVYYPPGRDAGNPDG